MDSKSTSYETAIKVSETESTKQKSSAAAAAAPAAATTVATTKAIPHNQKGGWRRGVAIFDFILRLCALVAAVAAASAMGTSEETLTLFTQFSQFEASYEDLPALSYFVVANAIASAYLFLSLPFSIVGIVRPHLVGVKLLLSILDTVMLAFTIAAAAAAAAIVYLAHYGNPPTQWRAICQQFGDFCERVSGAVVASFIAAFILILLVVFSAVARRSH